MSTYNDGVRDALSYIREELGIDLVSESDILARVSDDGLVIRSVFLECRQWRDRTAGETYTSAALWINQRVIAYFPLQYGGLENMEDTAGLYLERVGVLPGPDGYHLRRRLRELGVDYYTATQWRIKRETWTVGEKLTAEELREELAADYYRAVAV